MTTYDTIIIGAGANGLATAAQHAKRGKRVLVLEKRATIGGQYSTEEIFPGFKMDVLAHDLGWINDDLLRTLKLTPRWLPSETTLFSPLGDTALKLYRDSHRTSEALKPFSARDAEAFPAFQARTLKFARLLAQLYAQNAPDIFSKNPLDWLPLAGVGLQLKALGKRDMMEMIRMIPVPVQEWLDDTFESDALKGALGLAGVTNIMQGPRATGTALVFLHHHAGAGALREIRRVQGGVGAFINELADAARRLGAEIRTSAQVARILVADGKITGVALANGEEIKATRVFSSLDPRTTFLKLIEPKHLSAEFMRDVKNIKMKGIRAKLNLALGELPNFKGAQPADLRGVISIAPSLRYIEDAYDAAKYGEMPEKPTIEAILPTVSDPSLAPADKHILLAWVQFAPYALQGGWTAEAKSTLMARAINALAEHAPNLQSSILHAQLLTPADIESEFGAAEGNIYHGELTLDQILFMRPLGGLADYSTPLEGLSLCGGGTHPGSGMAGAAGWLAGRK
jgi:phytoene dehydrogenase-like protein